MKYYFKVIGLSFGIMQIAGLLALPLRAAEAIKNAAGPRVQFSETNFDFGKVSPTDKPQHDFIVTNTGTAVLEITDVRPGCGCTTAGAWDKKVEPGKTGKIPLAFNPANFSGPVSKGATVTCNDPAQASIYLHFQATVWRPIELQPQYLYFMPVEGELTNETKVVRIINNQEEAITLETPQSASPAFHTELKTVRAGKEFELRVTYIESATNNRPQGNVTIATSLTNMPSLSVNVVAMPQPALVAMPQAIQIPAGPLAPGYQYPAMVRNNSHTPVQLSEPSISAEGATVHLQEIEAGKNFRLNIGFPTNFQVRAGQQIELSVKTSNPKYPVLHVPITQSAPPVPVIAPTATATGPK